MYGIERNTWGGCGAACQVAGECLYEGHMKILTNVRQRFVKQYEVEGFLLWLCASIDLQGMSVHDRAFSSFRVGMSSGPGMTHISHLSFDCSLRLSQNLVSPYDAALHV
jgi:hypothetical protein